jgi:predicted AAA+ superfamily ATPase
LEASGLVYLLPPYFSNFGKRLIKSPKAYWLDTSIATFLVGLHSPEPLIHDPVTKECAAGRGGRVIGKAKLQEYVNA